MKSRIFALLIIPVLLAACSPAPTPTPQPSATPRSTLAPSVAPTQDPPPAAPTATPASLDPGDWGMQEIDAPAFSPAKGAIHYSVQADVAQAFIAKVMAEGHLKYDPGQTNSWINPEIYNQVFALLYPGSPAEKDWREVSTHTLSDWVRSLVRWGHDDPKRFGSDEPG